MRNQDSSATAHPSISLRTGGEVEASTGETKREKAFWQVYSAIIGNSKTTGTWQEIAEVAIIATGEGFKALDAKD